MFPKGDHVNVGLYTSHETDAPTPADLRAYTHDRLGPDDLSNLAGQRVGLGGWSYRPRSERVFLVGDAAGLAEPILGEGIYYAIKSGQAAAEAIAAGLSGVARCTTTVPRSDQGARTRCRVCAARRRAFLRGHRCRLSDADDAVGQLLRDEGMLGWDDDPRSAALTLHVTVPSRAGAARAARAYDRLAAAQRSDAAAVSRLRLTWRMPVIPSLPSWHAYS